jgi:hypothetical protein
VGTEELRYGLRLALLHLPAHPLLRSPEALAVVGPHAFGYQAEQQQAEQSSHSKQQRVGQQQGAAVVGAC